MRDVYFLLVSLGMGFSGNTVASSATNTSLGGVFEELSIVSRIINAVALESFVLGNSTNLRIATAELMKVSLEDFEKVINQSPEPVLTEIQSKFRDVRGSSSNVSDVLLYEYATLAAHIGARKRYLKLRERLNKPNFNVTDFTSRAISDVFGCDTSILQPVSEFYEMLNMKQEPAPKDQVPVFVNFDNKYPDFINRCLNNKKFWKNRTIAAAPDIKLLEILGSISKFLSWYELHQKTLSGTHFDALRGELSRSGSWKTSGGKLLEQAIEIQNGIINSTVSSTSRRIEVSDILWVLSDVRSQWFKEQVAQGKDVEPLVAALTPLQASGASLQKLAGAWKAVDRHFQGEKRKIVKYKSDLMNVENYQGPDQNDVLVNASAIFGSCQAKTVKPIDQGIVGNFVQRHASIEQFLKDYDLVEEKISALEDSFDLSKIQTDLDAIAQAIPQNIDIPQVDSTNQRIRGRTSYTQAMDFFGKISEIYKLQSAAYASFLNVVSLSLQFSDFETYARSLNETGYFEWLECFQQQKLSAEKLRKVIKFVYEVRLLSNEDRFNATSNFLAGLVEMKKDFGDVKSKLDALQRTDATFEPVLKLENAREVAEQLADGLAVIGQMVRAQGEKEELWKPVNYSAQVLKMIRANDTSPFWADPKKAIEGLMSGIEELEKFAPSIRSSRILKMRQVFVKAERVSGISKFQESFANVAVSLAPRKSLQDFRYALENAEKLKTLDLDFASHKKALNSAHHVIQPISAFFDDVFGAKSKTSRRKSSALANFFQKQSLPLIIIAACIGILALLIVLLVAVCFRRQLKDKYLYYFPNKAVLEQRWRYSLFRDRENGRNGLIEATRDVNPCKVMAMIRRGAYVDVYNDYGNTALHLATSQNNPVILAMLIKNGAERSLLNTQNKTAEQMIPADSKKFAQVRAIFNETRGKKYRVRVPREFPIGMFHIYIEPQTDEKLTMDFMNKWKTITSDEPHDNNTHCIVKTNAEGMLEVETVELLVHVFRGLIIVKESWMTAVLRNRKAIREDCKHLVEHVKWKGTVFKNCVIPWSQAHAKGAMPYLIGAFVVVVIPDYPMMDTLAEIISEVGGTLLTEFPSKDDFNPGSHPYLHADLGPIILIHDENSGPELDVYRNDDMFALFTEREFIAFLLKREIQQDTSPEPTPVTAGS